MFADKRILLTTHLRRRTLGENLVSGLDAFAGFEASGMDRRLSVWCVSDSDCECAKSERFLQYYKTTNLPLFAKAAIAESKSTAVIVSALHAKDSSKKPEGDAMAWLLSNRDDDPMKDFALSNDRPDVVVQTVDQSSRVLKDKGVNWVEAANCVTAQMKKFDSPPNETHLRAMLQFVFWGMYTHAQGDDESVSAIDPGVYRSLPRDPGQFNRVLATAIIVAAVNECHDVNDDYVNWMFNTSLVPSLANSEALSLYNEVFGFWTRGVRRETLVSIGLRVARVATQLLIWTLNKKYADIHVFVEASHSAQLREDIKSTNLYKLVVEIEGGCRGGMFIPSESVVTTGPGMLLSEFKMESAQTLLSGMKDIDIVEDIAELMLYELSPVFRDHGLTNVRLIKDIRRGFWVSDQYEGSVVIHATGNAAKARKIANIYATDIKSGTMFPTYIQRVNVRGYDVLVFVYYHVAAHECRDQRLVDECVQRLAASNIEVTDKGDGVFVCNTDRAWVIDYNVLRINNISHISWNQ